MDEDRTGELPFVHALALRMERRGLPTDVIAELLDIAPEAVAPLLGVAHAKLDRLGVREQPAHLP